MMCETEQGNAGPVSSSDSVADFAVTPGEQGETVSVPVDPAETVKPVAKDPLPWLVQRLRRQNES